MRTQPRPARVLFAHLSLGQAQPETLNSPRPSLHDCRTSSFTVRSRTLADEVARLPGAQAESEIEGLEHAHNEPPQPLHRTTTCASGY